MLKVDNINVYYGNIHAIKDVSFEVNEGEIVTLIGANGAGKSTILKTISGLLRTKTGDVILKGESIKSVAPHKIVAKGLAHVPEGRRVFLAMSVEENLEMGAYTQPASSIAPNMQEVFQWFPRLKERRRQMAGTLSGGEQQMLAMGRAMMSGAKVLLLEKAPKGQEGGNSRYAAQQAMWIDDTKASDEEILRYFQLMRGKSTNPSDEVYKAFIAEARRLHGDVRTLASGSSIKICLVAEGTADAYPRLAPTMEWDTAAADAVARAAGARVAGAESGAPLHYNKADLHNPHFVVRRDAKSPQP